MSHKSVWSRDFSNGLNGKIDSRIYSAYAHYYFRYLHLPEFMTPEELTSAGYPVSRSYKPVVSFEELKAAEGESTQGLYQRIQTTVRQLVISRYPRASILFVGHATTMDASARELLGKGNQQIPDEANMMKLGLRYPCISTIALIPRSRNTFWTLQKGAIPPIATLDFSSGVDTSFLVR